MIATMIWVLLMLSQTGAVSAMGVAHWSEEERRQVPAGCLASLRTTSCPEVGGSSSSGCDTCHVRAGLLQGGCSQADVRRYCTERAAADGSVDGVDGGGRGVPTAALQGKFEFAYAYWRDHCDKLPPTFYCSGGGGMGGMCPHPPCTKVDQASGRSFSIAVDQSRGSLCG
jgi:hypothetical protein